MDAESTESSLHERSPSPTFIRSGADRALATPSIASVATEAISVDEGNVITPCENLDHRKIVSYHPHLNVDAHGKKYQQYLVISRRAIVKPSFYLKKGVDKRGGREFPFERNVYLKGYEILEISFSNGKECWNGFISYDENNLYRKKGTKDDTWKEDKFMPLVQSVLQFPEKFVSYGITLTVEKSKEDKSLSIKIRTTRGGYVENVMKPCRLNLAVEEDDPNVPNLASKLFLEAFEINNRNLIVACRSNQLESAMTLLKVSKGNCDVNCKDDYTQWSLFQWVCYNGLYDFANYLILEHKNVLDMNYCSPFDGNNALHCAVMSGNLELVQLLILFDVPLVPNLNNETPPELSLICKHRHVVEYFYGEDSKICEDGKKLHGIRNKVITRLYTLREKPRKKAMEEDLDLE